MEKYPWTESGRELLLIINLYIQQEGGAKALYKKIIDKEREIRRQSYVKSYTRNTDKKRKHVVLKRNMRKKEFSSTKEAADFLKCKPVNIRNSISHRCRCKGWKVSYTNLQC